MIWADEYPHQSSSRSRLFQLAPVVWCARRSVSFDLGRRAVSALIAHTSSIHPSTYDPAASALIAYYIYAFVCVPCIRACLLGSSYHEHFQAHDPRRPRCPATWRAALGTAATISVGRKVGAVHALGGNCRGWVRAAAYVPRLRLANCRTDTSWTGCFSPGSAAKAKAKAKTKATGICQSQSQNQSQSQSQNQSQMVPCRDWC